MSKKEFVYRKEGLKLTKPDEIVVEQKEDIKELKKQISDLEKALEWACKELNDYKKRNMPQYYNFTAEDEMNAFMLLVKEMRSE